MVKPPLIPQCRDGEHVWEEARYVCERCWRSRQWIADHPNPAPSPALPEGEGAERRCSDNQEL